MDWTSEQIQRLRDLWAEGHSTAEIGRRLGVSKNAVVSRAHRSDLTPRKSPIKRRLPPEKFVAPPASIPRVHALPDRRFSPEEDATILRFPDAAPRWLACILVDRNPAQIWQRRSKLQERQRLEARLPPVRPEPARQMPKPVVAAPKHTPLRSTLPPLASVQAPVSALPLDTTPYRPKRRHDGTGCSYPIGEPGTKAFRFCDADLVSASYCQIHNKICHRRVVA